MPARPYRLLVAPLGIALALGGGAFLGTAGATSPRSTTRHPLNAQGLVPGRVSAFGDSVMIDYAPDLEHDVHGVVVDAAVSEQWDTGVADVRAARADGQLGTEAIIGLGTNGPISMAQFDAMRSALAGVSRVVFVTVHVDRPWQGEVNATLAAGVRATPQARLADWYRLSASHPDWFYSDGTHLPIGGTGAQACAALIARTLEAPDHGGAGKETSGRPSHAGPSHGGPAHGGPSHGGPSNEPTRGGPQRGRHVAPGRSA